MAKYKMFIKNLPSFYKNILIMFRGNVLAQIFSTLGIIYLAKLYGETTYGLFGLFISLSSIITAINTFQLEHSIITSRKNTNAWFSCVIFLMFFGTILFIPIFLGINVFLLSFNTTIILLSILGALLSSFILINESYLTYLKRFNIISNIKAIFGITVVIIQYILYHLYKDYGLIFGFLISSLGVVLFYLITNYRSYTFPKLPFLKEKIIENNSFLKYLYPSNIINTISLYIMPILIASFFDLKIVGIYFLSLKIVSTPIQLLSNSISKVYFQKTSVISPKELFPLTKKIVVYCFFIMICILFILNTIGIYLLEFFFEKNWENLRIFTFILSFLALCRSLFNPISSIIIITDKNHVSLIFNLYLLTVNILAFLIGRNTNDIIYTIIILSIFGGIGYLTLLFYFLKNLKNNVRED